MITIRLSCLKDNIMSINNFKHSIVLLLFGILFPSVMIKGFIYDSKTKEPLIGASIFFVGTPIGGASDIDGSYSLGDISSCSTCKYTLKSTYIGYKDFYQDMNII